MRDVGMEATLIISGWSVSSMIKFIPDRQFTQPPSRYTEATLIRALEEKGIAMPPCLLEMAQNEQLLVYDALTCASEKLFLSFVKSHELAFSNFDFEAAVADFTVLFSNISHPILF